LHRSIITALEQLAAAARPGAPLLPDCALQALALDATQFFVGPGQAVLPGFKGGLHPDLVARRLSERRERTSTPAAPDAGLPPIAPADGTPLKSGEQSRRALMMRATSRPVRSSNCEETLAAADAADAAIARGETIGALHGVTGHDQAMLTSKMPPLKGGSPFGTRSRPKTVHRSRIGASSGRCSSEEPIRQPSRIAGSGTIDLHRRMFQLSVFRSFSSTKLDTALRYI
jgi:hypothetical protein